MDYKKIELLAPAGSYEGFEAALGAGADAVYVGGSAFGARACAKNFEPEELLEAIDMAHIHGKKLYLTVNTLLKNKELEGRLYAYLAPYYEAGLDAVIVQDLGVFSFIRKNFPGLALHASTQMTITGPKGMRFLEQQGASRVVAARELSLEEIAQMHRESPIEIEAFVHGALCYCYSGQCLMSSMFGGRSGNRGRCAQPCRLPYQTAAGGEGFRGKEDLCPLSLKDMNTIEILPQIIGAGVTSLKIEGRMKQPGYTAGVTAVYRKYLDLLAEKGPERYEVEARDLRYLVELFSRGGSSRGYYEMAHGPSMMAFTNEKKIGDIQPEITKRKEKIYGNLILFPGSPVILDVSCGNVHASASGGEVQHAQNQPLERERILKQMEKLGNTPFVWENLHIEMDNHIFVPMKVLNEVRREALSLLKENILKDSRRNLMPKKTPKKKTENTKAREIPEFYVSCEDTKTAKLLVKEAGICGMYLPYESMEICLDEGLARGLEMYLSLPHIVRGEMPAGYLEQAQKWISMGMKGFLVRNLEAYAMLKEAGLASRCVLDASMYTWNDEAVDFWRNEGILRNTVPLELNEGEIRHRDNQDSEMIVCGYLPLMVSAQCVRGNVYGCNGCEEVLRIRDRYGKEFPVSCFCHPWKAKNTRNTDPCYNIIYNSIPYGLTKEKEQVLSLGIKKFRLSFTIEQPEEARRTLREFLGVYCGTQMPSAQEYTKGHFKRGAE